MSWQLWLMPIAAIAVAGCSNSDSVTTSQVAFVGSYVVGPDDTAIEVWVDVGCAGTRVRVFAAEAADTVKLFVVRNSPDCGTPNGDVGYRSSAVVVLDRPLADRDVVDAGCEFALGTTPCTPTRSPAPPDS